VRDTWTAWALAALALGAVAIVATSVDPTQDDGYYYFQIARNVARGQGSTFDGLHPTNGYHPLWLLALVPVFAAVPGREAAAGAAVWLQGALLAGATATAYLAARHTLGPSAAAAAACVFLALALRPSLGGLEFAIHALAVAACLWAHAARREWLLGVLLAAAFLARLDNLLLAVVLGGTVVIERRATRAVFAWWSPRVLAPVLLAAAVYAAVNLALFGHALPVSGQAKRLWSAHLLAQDPVYQAHGFLAAKLSLLAALLTNVRNPLGLVLATGSVGALALSYTRALRPLRPFALFATAQLAAYALLFHGELSFARWYFVMPLLLAGLLAGALVEAMPRAAGRALVAALAVAPLAFAARWRTREPPTAPLHAAARWMEAGLPPGSRVGSWVAGTVGYASGHTVVNLDGLVNTRAYLDREQYDQCAYWAANGLTHLVDAFAERGTPPRPVVVPVALPMDRYYAGCAERLERVWEGPGPADGSWRLRAYRIRQP
jgi:hypothetical protein